MDDQDRYETFEVHTPAWARTVDVDYEPVAGPTRLLLEIEDTGHGLVFAETDVVSGYTLAWIRGADMKIADHDETVMELHRHGLCPQQIAERIAERVGRAVDPGAVQERIIWLTMPKAHARSC